MVVPGIGKRPQRLLRNHFPEGFELPFFKEQFGAFITFACLAAAVSAFKANVEKKEKSAEL